MNWYGSAATDPAVAAAAMSTAPRLLAQRAMQSPNVVAVREILADGSLRDWTWRALHEAVSNFAAALMRHGVPAGERVVILCDPGVTGIVGFVGAHAAGCVASGLQVSHGPQTWQDVISELQPAVLVADRLEHAKEVRSGFPPALRLVVHSDDAAGATPAGTPVPGPLVRGWTEAMREGANQRATDPAACEHRMRKMEPDDVCAVYYTSGSTGRPKGVLVSWRGLALSFCGFFAKGHVDPPPTASDRALHVIPVATTSGQWFGIACPLIFGCTAYVPLPQVSEAAARRIAQPTLFYGRPPFWTEAALRIEAGIAARPRLWRAAYRRLMQRAGRRAGEGASGLIAAMERTWLASLLRPLLHEEGLASVRHAFCGGSPLPAPVVDQWFKWGITIRMFYGMTECSGVATVVAGDSPSPGTVGRPSPCADVRLDRDGEVLIGGPIVFKGYLGMPEATAKAIDADGYYHTGDLGQFDSLGNLTVIDRKSSLIRLSTGESVLPSQIELLLMRSPCVAVASLVGEGRAAAGMLVEIRPDEVRRRLPPELAASLQTYEQLVGHPRTVSLIGEEIELVNQSLAADGKPGVAVFRLIPHALDPLDRELRTATGKIRRANLHQRHAALIDEMYGGPATVLEAEHVPEGAGLAP